MKEADIIKKAIDNEKLAIKDQVAIFVCGLLLAVASGILLTTVIREFVDGEEERLAAISYLSPIVVGLIINSYPAKEILDRRENIRNLQTIRYTCNVVLKPDEEEKCFDLITKYL